MNVPKANCMINIADRTCENRGSRFIFGYLYTNLRQYFPLAQCRMRPSYVSEVNFTSFVVASLKVEDVVKFRTSRQFDIGIWVAHIALLL